MSPESKATTGTTLKALKLNPFSIINEFYSPD
jgi:hypothetical protein